MNKVICLLLLCFLSMFSGQAYALNISPGIEIDSGVISGIATKDQNLITAYLSSTYGFDELYKAEVPSGELELLAGSYETTFANIPTDPSEAIITYISGPYISDAYLLVKDGNHSPFWYLFDLTKNGLNWDGIETLYLSGFWMDNGAISHVSLYGSVAPVPEPSTILLLGLGLVGLAGLGRRKIKG